MKTNLDKFFSTNESSEKNGIWVEIADEVSFRIKRFGGRNQVEINKVRANYFKPYVRQIQNGTIAPEKEHELYVKVFVECVLTDWKGVTDENGNAVEFNKENAFNLLHGLPDLFDFLVKESLEDDNYRDDLGNS